MESKFDVSEKEPVGLIGRADELSAPRASGDCTQRLAAWFDLVDATDQLLLATFRSRYRTESEVQAAYRRFHEQQNAEHDRKLQEIQLNYNRRWKIDGG